jgi:LmbE family N-acetylglucosaminyl deacetylase
VRLTSFQPKTVIAVYAHPDDADVAAGGALAQWASNGSQVHLVVTCRGDKGDCRNGAVEGDLAAVRSKELRRAADILGATSLHELGFGDGEVINSEGFREQLVSIIRSTKADLVVGPDPTATFFGGVYVNHRDHRETGWALLDSVAPAAAMAGYFPSVGEAHQVSTMLLTGTHEPDIAIDIASSLEVKIQAVLCHQSQVGDDSDGISQVVRSRAAQAGRPVGVAFAESFRCVTFNA